METIKVQKNQIIAKQKEKVKAWYLILEGSVVQRNSYARIVLNKESVIGVIGKRPVFVRLYCERRFCACSFSIQYSR